MPDGLLAANQLGLTNVVPAKTSFVTDGHSRTLKIDRRTVRFRYAGPSVMHRAGKPAAPVVQALRWPGPDAAADARVVSTLKRLLPDNVKRDLHLYSRTLPGWALPLVRNITTDRPLPHEWHFRVLSLASGAGKAGCVRSGREPARPWPSSMEKDFWVCLVPDALYNRLPGEHPRLLFKGGTSLSKAFGLIERLSEDIAPVVYREGLGFEGERDPTVASDVSNRRRAGLFKELRAACSNSIRGDLQSALTRRIEEIAEGRHVGLDEDDGGQTLLIEYPGLFPSSAVASVASRVRIEYVAGKLPDWSFEVGNIRVIAPERSYWEKLLILHRTHSSNGIRVPCRAGSSATSRISGGSWNSFRVPKPR